MDAGIHPFDGLRRRPVGPGASAQPHTIARALPRTPAGLPATDPCNDGSVQRRCHRSGAGAGRGRLWTHQLRPLPRHRPQTCRRRS